MKRMLHITCIKYYTYSCVLVGSLLCKANEGLTFTLCIQCKLKLCVFSCLNTQDANWCRMYWKDTKCLGFPVLHQFKKYLLKQGNSWIQYQISVNINYKMWTFSVGIIFKKTRQTFQNSRNSITCMLQTWRNWEAIGSKI